MEDLRGETLQALGEVPPEVLRALAGVPVDVLAALRDVTVERLKGEPREGREKSGTTSSSSGPFTGEIGEDLHLALKQIDKLLQATDADVVMCFGKWRDRNDAMRPASWWNGWIDSGGGGVTRLVNLPPYQVAEVFSVLGSEVRLAILRSLLDAPKSAAELVSELHLGTTGQAYHHLQELTRTGFVEGREGRYHFGPKRRAYFTALAVAADFVPKETEDAQEL